MATKTTKSKASKTVDPAKTEATSEEGKKREPKQRVAFITLIPAEMLDEKGLIVGVPEGYDTKEHLAPKRTEFANDADFLDFQANVFDAVAAEKTKRANGYRAEAAQLREYGDPEQRKQVQKLHKMAKALKDLKSALGANGAQIDLADLLADEDAE